MANQQLVAFAILFAGLIFAVTVAILAVYIGSLLEAIFYFARFRVKRPPRPKPGSAKEADADTMRIMKKWK